MSKTKSIKKIKKRDHKTKVNLSSVKSKVGLKPKISPKKEMKKKNELLSKKSAQKKISAVNPSKIKTTNNYRTKPGKGKKKTGVSIKSKNLFPESSYKLIWNIFEHSQIATICRTSNGKLRDMNDAAQKLIGYGKEEIPDTKTWLSKLYTDQSYRIKIDKTIRESFLRNDDQQHLEISIITKSGEKKNLLALYNNISRKENLTGFQIVQFLDITDRKKVEEENLQQKYLIEQLLLNVPDKIYFKDLQSKFIAISQSFYRTLNISSENEIRGKTDFDIYDYEHASDAFNDEQQIIKTGQPIIGKEEKEVWSGGREHWVSTTKMPYRDAKGSITGTFGISRDITEIIRARNLLKESEERYRKLIDSSPFAILVHQNGKVVFANLACVKLVHAKSRNDVLDRNIYDFMSPEYVEISKKRVTAISKGAERIPSFELQYYCLDGEIIDLDVTAIPITYENIKSILVIATDITEKKLAYKKLIETEKRFESMFENHTASMLLIDPDSGSIINANKAAVNFYGYPKQMYLGMKVFDINLLPEQEIRKLMSQAVITEKKNFEVTHRLASGEFREVEISSSPIQYENKTFLFSIIHDITERKITENLLLENDKLLKKAQRMANVGHYVMNTANGNWIGSEQLDKIFGIDGSVEKNLELWTKLLHPADKENMIEYFSKHVIKEHHAFDKEYRIIRESDSQMAWVHGLGDLRFDESGNVTEMFGTIQDITDRKEAEHQLKLAQFATDKSQEMIFWITRDAKIIYVNEASCKRLDYTREEFESMTIFDIDPDYPRERWLELWEINKQMGSAIIETVHRTKQGEIFPVEISINIVTFGESDYNFAYARDITERKRVQQELEESEERYKSILEYSPYSLMVQQQDKLIYANNATVELLAAESPEELIGKNIFDFVHNDYKLALKNKIDESYSSMRPSNSIEEKLVCLNGNMIEVEMLSVPFILHGVYSTLFIIRFIGEIKAKNEELRKLSRAVSQSSAGIMIADKHGIIEYVNPKFTEISEYTEEDALGKTTRLLKSGEQSQEFYRELWDTILKGNEWRGAFRNKKKSGELYWEYDSISAIKNERGDITHFLAVKEDITEKKKIEEDILLAKDEAEEANKVKSSLLANMSHEFRTPLNGILGFAQLLKDTVVEDDVLMMTEKIEKSGKRLMNTLNAVLSLTELETEDFVVQENEIELTLFCNSIKSNFERIAHDKDLQLILDIQVPTLVTVSDESLLTKIVSSICDNAVKYTHQGKVIIQLTPPVEKENTQYAMINIIDTGMGIRKENHELIFKEFRQLSEGIRRDFEGLGLGLTLAKRMARLLEAEISVESELGKGSKFSVLVPIRTKSYSNTKDELTLGNKEVVNTEQQQKQDALKILLVEDNPLNIEVVQRFLSKTGNVKAVRDGKAALKIATDEHFDILLIDINLGSGIDGTEVLRLLRLQDNYKTTPAVALTGYASDTNKREFLAKGFTGYLAKPFEKKVLINLLKELV